MAERTRKSAPWEVRTMKAAGRSWRHVLLTYDGPVTNHLWSLTSPQARAARYATPSLRVSRDGRVVVGDWRCEVGPHTTTGRTPTEAVNAMRTHLTDFIATNKTNVKSVEVLALKMLGNTPPRRAP